MDRAVLGVLRALALPAGRADLWVVLADREPLVPIHPVPEGDPAAVIQAAVSPAGDAPVEDILGADVPAAEEAPEGGGLAGIDGGT